jgi:glutathione S-transferase
MAGMVVWLTTAHGASSVASHVTRRREGMYLPNPFARLGIVNDVSSFAATIIRLGHGISRTTADTPPGAPDQSLELYDYEGCPYCRKVRETLCELDLDVVVHPVAHGSPRRAELKQLGGRVQVPYLIDPNRQMAMYESEDIITYIYAQYGAGRARRGLGAFPVINTANSFFASAVRLGHGLRVVSGLATARRPASPLELYNIEGSPYCRKVREALCELDIEYVARNVPKGSPKREAFRAQAGKVQVPYLVDPNTGTAMFESDEIVAYLHTQYESHTAATSA